MASHSSSLSLLHDVGSEVVVRAQSDQAETELFRYVYRPTEVQYESPRPYVHPIRTRSGKLVTVFRPHDHVWHKGIAWSLSNVGPDNFWGGVTFRRGAGYRQLDNNGCMWHEGFDTLGVAGGVLRIGERLTWRTQHGRTVIAEERRLAVRVLADAGAWQLSFATTMHNRAGTPIPIGSPTTEGRDGAGYSGLFWRGPRSFTGGTVLTSDGAGGDELMGVRARWLAFTGRHDGHGRASTLVFRDAPGNGAPHNGAAGSGVPGSGAPVRWFVRSHPYACVCPAPFFETVYDLLPGRPLALRYDVVVADGALDTAGCAALADRAAELDPS